MSKIIIQATENECWEDCNGGCMACGSIEYGGIEPDARRAECSECGKRMVYGLAELAIMNLLVITEVS